MNLFVFVRPARRAGPTILAATSAALPWWGRLAEATARRAGAPVRKRGRFRRSRNGQDALCPSAPLPGAHLRFSPFTLIACGAKTQRK